MVYSANGIGEMSRTFHRLYRKRLVRGRYRDDVRPILVNNWEATYMRFKEANLQNIIKNAKSLGLEMFVLDDGWFGRRTDDSKGLGDYDVNKKKLHRGLKGISKYTNDKKLKFGLWFEPEMVNEDSSLYETHPDWAIKCEGRIPSKGRHQLVLDLSNKEVQDYIICNVNNILDSYNIEYVK